MKTLKILVGKKAHQHIKKNGLSPEDVHTVVGASGAAKWLTIFGLDRAILGDWLRRSEQEVDFMGTSIGAFKLAAATQEDPCSALDGLLDLYLYQRYEGAMTPEAINAECDKALDLLCSPKATQDLIHHPRYRFHIGVTRCEGAMASQSDNRLKLAVAQGIFQSARKQKIFPNDLTRLVFSDPRSNREVQANDGYKSQRVDLTSANFRQALLASASIPVFMHNVTHIDGVEPGVFRDGGILDYHPIPNRFWREESKGVTLYPHFYDKVKPEWFTKFFKQQASAEDLSDVVLLAPSKEFVKSLPRQRIPARQDLTLFHKTPNTRIYLWQEAIKRSHELGEEFLELTKTGQIAEQMELIQ